MGQYHKILNLDLHEVLHPHAFGDGLKLMEFGCSSNATMTALSLLLSNSGRSRGGGDFPDEDLTPAQRKLFGSWAGCRIIIAGDYAEPTDVGESPSQKENLYDRSETPPWKDISLAVKRLMVKDEWLRSNMRASWREEDKTRDPVKKEPHE